MARRPRPAPRKSQPTKEPVAPATAREEPVTSPSASSDQPTFWTRPCLYFAVAVLLILHVSLAVKSLVPESPTVDEVIHMPAGLTYWQTGSFRLYHHNPPLVKLIAALPVLFSNPAVDYKKQSWLHDPPNKAAFAHEFMEANAARYFELFTRARLLMPLFAVLGGLVVFRWSQRLYGNAAGLLSLTLWVLCPNVLAHGRLVTTDMGATAIGALATYVFWSYLKTPSMKRAVFAGLCLGLAQLTKFSLILLYALWPLMAAVEYFLEPSSRAIKRLARDAAIVVALSIVVIDAGYLFEGVGIPLGGYEFASGTLTRPVEPGTRRPTSGDPLLNLVYKYRVNRFRDTLLGAIPVPLPKHFLLGFDDQKLEAEGIPKKILYSNVTGPEGEQIDGYPVYLDGELAQTSWWYYYLFTLIYKVPEGTWLLVLTSLAVLTLAKRARAQWFDEFAVLLVPAVVLFMMSIFTNINLGLRYVLPIFPYIYIATGKLAPWASAFASQARRRLAWGFIALCLVATGLATFSINPHFLAYFNAVSGGPSRGAEHLIDSNLDWGQDLTTLRRWVAANAPNERIGLAYFGQINPRVFESRGEGFDWFLPPPLPKTMELPPPRYQFQDPTTLRLEPGIYAVSASLVEGLPWRVYDSPFHGAGRGWVPWSALIDTFGYFRELKPFERIGHSIYLYRVTPEDSARLSHYWSEPTAVPRR